MNQLSTSCPKAKAGITFTGWATCWLLPPRLNSTLRDDPPKQKAESYKKTGMRIAVESAKQVSGGWGKKDIKRRDEALLEWASSEWG